jgi:hypothetical protein
VAADGTVTFDKPEQVSLRLLRLLADLSKAHPCVKATADDVVSLDRHCQARDALLGECRKSGLEKLSPDAAALSIGQNVDSCQLH